MHCVAIFINKSRYNNMFMHDMVCCIWWGLKRELFC